MDIYIYIYVFIYVYVCVTFSVYICQFVFMCVCVRAYVFLVFPLSGWITSRLKQAQERDGEGARVGRVVGDLGPSLPGRHTSYRAANPQKHV